MKRDMDHADTTTINTQPQDYQQVVSQDQILLSQHIELAPNEVQLIQPSEEFETKIVKHVYNATLYGYWIDQSSGIWKTRDHNKYKIDKDNVATLIDGSHIPTDVDVCQPPSFSILDISGGNSGKQKEKKKKEKKREKKEKKKEKKERENKRQKKN